MPSMDRMRYTGIMAWIDAQMEQAERATKNDEVVSIHLDSTIVETLLRGVTESVAVRDAVVLSTFQHHGPPGCGLLVDLLSLLSHDSPALEYVDDRNALLVTIVFSAFMGGRYGTAQNYGRRVSDNTFVDMLMAVLDNGHTPGEVLEGMNLDEMLSKALEEVDA